MKYKSYFTFTVLIIYSAYSLALEPNMNVDNQKSAIHVSIKFPNNHGKKKADPEAVKKLQSEYHFSDQYAHFLLTQNGLNLDTPLSTQELKSNIPAKKVAESTFDLRYIYDFNVHSEFTDVIAVNKEENSFLPYFFYIGRGYDGSAYAEVCVGKEKGKIIFINGDVFIGDESPQEIADNLGIIEEKYNNLTQEEMVTLILKPDLDVAYIVANSFDEFIHDALIYNLQNKTGEVVITAEE